MDIKELQINTERESSREMRPAGANPTGQIKPKKFKFGSTGGISPAQFVAQSPRTGNETTQEEPLIIRSESIELQKPLNQTTRDLNKDLTTVIDRKRSKNFSSDAQKTLMNWTISSSFKLPFIKNRQYLYRLDNN